MTRLERAAALAERYPSAREALLFYARIAEFQGDWVELRELVLKEGPPMLRDVAVRLTPESIEQEPEGFFARVLRRGNPPAIDRVVETNRCPKCGGIPQVGVLRPQGDGSSFSVVCGVCLHEWTHARGHCPSCGEYDENRIAYFSAEGLDHMQTQVCESCGRYLHVVNLGKDALAVPDVDEVAALAMDVWAREQGWEKVYPNLIGI